MAYYAFLDDNNIVVNVIVGKDENEDGVDWEQHYSNLYNKVCKRTSYNTFAGKHRKGNQPFRKNYAGIGYSYDPQRDAFIPPKPFESWVLNEDTCTWDAPVALPEDDKTGDPPKRYTWNEETTSWIEVQNGS